MEIRCESCICPEVGHKEAVYKTSYDQILASTHYWKKVYTEMADRFNYASTAARAGYEAAKASHIMHGEHEDCPMCTLIANAISAYEAFANS